MHRTCAWVVFLHSTPQFAPIACSSLFCTLHTGKKHTDNHTHMHNHTYCNLKTSAVLHSNCQYLMPANQSSPHALMTVMDHCLLKTPLSDGEHTQLFQTQFKHPPSRSYNSKLTDSSTSVTSVCVAPPLDVADIVSPLLQSFVQKSVTVKRRSFCLFEPVLSLLKHPA